jgi:hypothetical protein
MNSGASRWGQHCEVGVCRCDAAGAAYDPAEYLDICAKVWRECVATVLLLFVQVLREAGTLLMQREIPEDVNLQAAQVP